MAYLDRPDICGEALAGMLRPGNAGSNTAADHKKVLALALAALPEQARPRPGEPDSPQVLLRTDSAGATHAFTNDLRDPGCRFLMGFAVDGTRQTAVLALEEDAWIPAHNLDGEPHDGAWVVESSAWPPPT